MSHSYSIFVLGVASVQQSFYSTVSNFSTYIGLFPELQIANAIELMIINFKDSLIMDIVQDLTLVNGKLQVVLILCGHFNTG